jgi:hypothetical protein
MSLKRQINNPKSSFSLFDAFKSISSLFPKQELPHVPVTRKLSNSSKSIKSSNHPIDKIGKSPRKSSRLDSSRLDSSRESSIVDSSRESSRESSQNPYNPPIIRYNVSKQDDFTIVNTSREFILAIDNYSNDEAIPEPLELDSRNMAFIMELDEQTRIVNIKILQGIPIPPEKQELVMQYKINIIKNFLYEIQKMNIPLLFPCIGYSNVPRNFGHRQSMYHQDSIVSNVICDSFRGDLDKIISNNGVSRHVDLSFFKYKDDCVSTTIKIFYNGEWIEIRFDACPTTTLAINNVLTQHSKPFIMKDVESKMFTSDRRELNKKVLSNVGEERSLNRIGIKFLTQDQLTGINEMGNIYLTTFDFPLPNPERKIQVRTLSNHLGITSLFGGKRKRKRKSRKYKKKYNNITKRI